MAQYSDFVTLDQARRTLALGASLGAYVWDKSSGELKCLLFLDISPRVGIDDWPSRDAETLVLILRDDSMRHTEQ